MEYCRQSQMCISVSTIAAYQMENCTLAVRAIEVLDGGRTVTEEHIREGVSACFWSGRMEEVLPEVYIDGAHNADGIRAFLETAAQDEHQGKRLLLFGVAKDKAYGRMVEELVQSGLFDRIGIVPIQGGRTASAEELERVFGRYPGCAYEKYENAAAALCRLLEERRDGERIYVAGSLYLAGEIKELLSHDQFRGRIEKISSQP